MTKSCLKLLAVALSVMLVGSAVIFSSGASAQQRPSRSFDPWARLKKALEEAGAPALAAQQEEQLKALIEARRGGEGKRAGRQAGAGNDFESTRKAYDAAILAGDQAGANAQAAALANLSAAAMKARLEAEAKFKLDMLAVLKAGNQLDALTQKFGSEGVLRLLGGPAGGPGGHRGPGGFGGRPGLRKEGAPRRP